jgi:hypothetical protein
MKTKMRILSILCALAATLGTARADLITMQITGPQGSAFLTNGGSGPVFGLVNTTGIVGVLGANLNLGVDTSLFSIATIQLTNTLDVPETINILTTDPNFNAPGSGMFATTLSVSNLSGAFDSATSFSTIVGGSSTSTTPVTVVAPSGTSVSPSAFFSESGSTTLSNSTSITLAAGAETTLTVTTQIANVPEPSSLLLASGALVGFFGLRRRRA